MTTAEDPAFGDLVRHYRRVRGLTQEELAEQATLSVRAISDLERGLKYRPRKDTVQLLADALGLDGAEREVFQHSARQSGQLRLVALEGEMLGANLPSEQATDIRPNNLPDEPTPFIGREGEMASLMALLQQPRVRLVTLTGPGGSGKTRLALQVASTLLHAHPDRVFLVSLAPLTDPELVAPTIAATLGITDSGQRSLLETLQRALQDKRLLLVLDNFEHLLEAAPLVGDLLRSCTSLQVLATSRAALRLSAEHEFPVPPLSLPPLTLVPDFSGLAHVESMAFFVDRAQAARPDFVLTHENASSIAAICHRLDGLPLALELAAARIRILPPQALLGRLARRFDLLTGGARDRPTRQQTLRGAIDWSYSLLSPKEQTLFARLAVFAGGWTLEAAEAVCRVEGEQSIDVLDGIASLVEQSLVRQEGEREPRFGMLETIREYAAEKLAQAEEEHGVRDGHASYFCQMAREAAADLNGTTVGGWQQRLALELDNLRAALGWLRDHGEPAAGLDLATALGMFWMGRGLAAEGLGWLRTFLSACPESSELRGQALNDASFLAFLCADIEDARRLAEESLRMAREQGKARQIGRALGSLSRVMRAEREVKEALALSQEGIAIARRTRDEDLLAYHLLQRGEGMRMAHNTAEARRLYRESLELYRALGQAKMAVENLHNLIEVELDEGNLDQAATLLREKVEAARQLEHAGIDAYSVLESARLAAGRDNLVLAARLLAAATRKLRSMGLVIDPPEQAGYDATLSLVRERFNAETLASLWEEGEAMIFEDAMAYALDQIGLPTDPGATGSRLI